MRSPEELALIAGIADDLPAGVWVATAPEGRFVYANRVFEEIMGIGPIAEVGAGGYAEPYGIFRRDGRLYPEENLPFARALVERTTVVVDDIVIHRRDGRRVFVRATAKPILDDLGTITHIAIATRGQKRKHISLKSRTLCVNTGSGPNCISSKVSNTFCGTETGM